MPVPYKKKRTIGLHALNCNAECDQDNPTFISKYEHIRLLNIKYRGKYVHLIAMQKCHPN